MAQITQAMVDALELSLQVAVGNTQRLRARCRHLRGLALAPGTPPATRARFARQLENARRRMFESATHQAPIVAARNHARSHVGGAVTPAVVAGLAKGKELTVELVAKAREFLRPLQAEFRNPATPPARRAELATAIHAAQAGKRSAIAQQAVIGKQLAAARSAIAQATRAKAAAQAKQVSHPVPPPPRALAGTAAALLALATAAGLPTWGPLQLDRPAIGGRSARLLPAVPSRQPRRPFGPAALADLGGAIVGIHHPTREASLAKEDTSGPLPRSN